MDTARPDRNRASRADERNAVIAGFLGWTLDAFDFFVLTFVLADVARGLRRRPPGHRADDHGRPGDAAGRRRRLRPDGRPLRPPHPADAQRRLLRAAVGRSRARAELHDVPGPPPAVRRSRWAGEWGVGASLALEIGAGRAGAGCSRACCSRATRCGNLLAAISSTVSSSPAYGWRALFFVGGLPALLSLFILANVKESRGLARAQDRLGHLLPIALGSTGGDSSTSSC